MHFESGEKPRNCQLRSLRRHNMRYSIERRPHLNPSHWWTRPESEWANGHCSSRRSSGKSTRSDINPGWEVFHQKSSSGSGPLLVCVSGLLHDGGPHPDCLFLLRKNGDCEKEPLSGLPGERAFSNYSIVQRIILFQSGTSHKTLMVTSL